MSSPSPVTLNSENALKETSALQLAFATLRELCIVALLSYTVILALIKSSFIASSASLNIGPCQLMALVALTTVIAVVWHSVCPSSRHSTSTDDEEMAADKMPLLLEHRECYYDEKRTPLPGCPASAC
jgi:hypothetical protein